MQETEGTCTSGWSIAFSGSKKWVPFDPDMNATYWYYAITRDPDDTTGFRFRGRFAHARYQAYNVYDDDTKDFVWGRDPAHRSSISDVDVVPDPGSGNPYLLSVPRDTPYRDYTVWVVPDGSDTSGYRNVITFPTTVERLSVFLRVYLPDTDLEGTRDFLSGGVPLPSIEDFDTATGAAVPCLPTRNIFAPDDDGGDPGGDEDGGDPPNPGANTGGNVRFYRLNGGGLYPNEDSAYLATIFNGLGDDSVAVIRVKPPSHTDTSGGAALPAQTMVRYWSFNVCSIALTNVTACVADFEAVVAADGYVYVVLGRRPSLAGQTEGINFLPWGPHQKILLVYRNMFSNRYFPSSAAAVPLYSADETRSADQFIGDYAPIGIYGTEQRFLEDGFGFPVLRQAGEARR